MLAKTRLHLRVAGSSGASKIGANFEVWVLWQQAYATWHTSSASGLGKDTPLGDALTFAI